MPTFSPLDRKLIKNNIVDRFDRMYRDIRRKQRQAAKLVTLEALTNDLGTVTAGQFVAVASGGTTADVTSSSFSGTFMSGNLETIADGETARFAEVLNGVTQFAVGNGKATAGAGAVFMDEDGVTIELVDMGGSTSRPPETNAVKWTKGVANERAILDAAYYDIGPTTNVLSTWSVDNGTGAPLVSVSINSYDSGTGVFAVIADTTDLLNISTASGAVFNEGGAAALDLRAESDTEANMIFLDSSADTLQLGGTTNGVKISKGGTIELTGTATVYDDVQFLISSGRVSVANAPDWQTFTTNTSEYGFAVDDYIDLAANEAPHWWKLGSAADIHLHITTKAANTTGANRFAKFTVFVAYGVPGTAWLETSFTAELTIPTGTPALMPFYLDMGNLTLTGYGLSTHIKCRVKRIAATGGTEYAGDIFITQVGAHLEKDSLGSNEETTK